MEIVLPSISEIYSRFSSYEPVAIVCMNERHAIHLHTLAENANRTIPYGLGTRARARTHTRRIYDESLFLVEMLLLLVSACAQFTDRPPVDRE